MVMTSLPLALVVLGALQVSTDTTFAVRAGTRLDLRDLRGTVSVQGWDQAQVRLRADRRSRSGIQVEDRGGVITVRGRSPWGDHESATWRLSVPRGMALSVGGQEVDVDITGVTGEVRIDLVEGDIVLREVGPVNASTVDGDIIVRGAMGNVRVNTTDGELTLAGVTGNIFGNTLDGDVTLDRIQATEVTVTTVDGDITYDGVLRDDGRYRLSTHDGDITLYIPQSVNATVTVATFDGDFESSFPVRIPPGRHQGHRFSFTIGGGNAQVELESFDGAIGLYSR